MSPLCQFLGHDIQHKKKEPKLPFLINSNNYYLRLRIANVDNNINSNQAIEPDPLLESGVLTTSTETEEVAERFPSLTVTRNVRVPVSVLALLTEALADVASLIVTLGPALCVHE